VGLLHSFLDHLSHDELLARVDLALDGASLGIWDWDLRDDSVQFDRRWCHMLGLVHEDTPMHLDTWRTRVHPDDLAGAYRDIQAHLDGRTPRYENIHRMRHTNGEWVHILDRGRVSGRDASGRPTRFTGTHLDVTATERAQQVLAEHDRQLHDLVAHLPSAVAMLDTRLRYLAASAAWLAMHDLEGQTLVGRACDEDGHWADVYARALRGERQGGDAEPWISPAGEQRWIRWDVRPWRSANGELGGVISSREDVTGEVRRQRAAQREREARMATLALFAGGIAHEINTPLQVIAVEAEVIVQELALPQPRLGEVADSARAIITTAHRAAEITHALRTLARDSRHDPPAPVPLSGLLRDTEALCRSRFDARGVGLRVVQRAPELRASGRPAELLHALLALLDNALAAAGAAPAKPWVRLEASRVQRWIELACIDSGAGISAAMRARLADPDSTDAASHGLSIARALAQRNGGELEYSSGEAPTTFVLRVPVAEE
jgi:PAS domain S-box-containing protein